MAHKVIDWHAVGRRLRMERKARGLTLEEAAEGCGVWLGMTVGNWEAGKVKPRLENLKKICQLYGCALDDIFNSRGEE